MQVRRAFCLGIISMLVFAADANAQNPVAVDQKFFGGTGNESGTGIAVVNTGTGFSIYASGNSEALGGEGILIKYLLPTGSTISSQSWSTTFPGAAGADAFNGVAATTTNAYVAGYSFSHTTDTVGAKEQKGITLNYASAGGVTWERQTPGAPGAYAYGGFEGLNGISNTLQSGQEVLYAVGTGQSGGVNGGRLFISKVDASGSVVWTRNHDNGGAVPGSAGLAVAANGTNAFLAGLNADSGTVRAHLRSYDASGGLAWSADSATAGQFNGITLDNSNSFLYAVGRATGVLGDFLIEKRTLSGSLVWTRTFDRSGAEDALSSVAIVDGRLFGVGSTRGGTGGGSDGAVLEFDPVTGDLLVTTLWGGAFDDSFTGVAAGEHALHVVGTTRSFGAGGSDMAFVTFLTGVPEPSSFATASVGLLGAYFWRRRPTSC